MCKDRFLLHICDPFYPVQEVNSRIHSLVPYCCSQLESRTHRSELIFPWSNRSGFAAYYILYKGQSMVSGKQWILSFFLNAVSHCIVSLVVLLFGVTVCVLLLFSLYSNRLLLTQTLCVKYSRIQPSQVTLPHVFSNHKVITGQLFGLFLCSYVQLASA